MICILMIRKVFKIDPFACVTPFVLCVNQNTQNIISANEVLYRWSVVGLTSINMLGWCHSVANTTHVSIQIIFAACIPQLYLWNTNMDTINGSVFNPLVGFEPSGSVCYISAVTLSDSHWRIHILDQQLGNLVNYSETQPRR